MFSPLFLFFFYFNHKRYKWMAKRAQRGFFHGEWEKPSVKYVMRRNIGFESSPAHSQVRECVASSTKREGWLRTTEQIRENGMSYFTGSFHPSYLAFLLFVPHRHAIFVPRCGSFYKLFISILLLFFFFSPSSQQIVSFFLSSSLARTFDRLRRIWDRSIFSMTFIEKSFLFRYWKKKK